MWIKAPPPPTMQQFLLRKLYGYFKSQRYTEAEKLVEIGCIITIKHLLCCFMPTGLLCFGVLSGPFSQSWGSITQWLCMDVTSFGMFKREVTQRWFDGRTLISLSMTTTAKKKTSTSFMVGLHSLKGTKTRRCGWDENSEKCSSS